MWAIDAAGEFYGQFGDVRAAAGWANEHVGVSWRVIPFRGPDATGLMQLPAVVQTAEDLGYAN